MMFNQRSVPASKMLAGAMLFLCVLFSYSADAESVKRDYCEKPHTHPIYLDGGVLCIQGRITPSDYDPAILNENFHTVLIKATGGDLTTYHKLALDLNDNNPDLNYVIYGVCTSACAMGLLPHIKRLIVRQNSVIASHRYFFDDFGDYRAFQLSSPMRPIPQTPEETKAQEAVILMAFNRQVRTVLDIENNLPTKRGEISIAEQFKIKPECFDAKYGFQAWDYYTLLNQAFFSGFIDTEHWIWPDRDDRFSFDGFKFPVCDEEGNLAFLP